jgi:hypothetical protein
VGEGRGSSKEKVCIVRLSLLHRIFSNNQFLVANETKKCIFCHQSNLDGEHGGLVG